MSQTAHGDIEGGGDRDQIDGHGDRDQHMATPNRPLQGKSDFGDSSGPLFSMYSKAAEDEDKKMVERWQKDADGILIFTGLFSAAVAALLAVTVQDLRPNSQDTSAFYLGNIYQVLADPNATRSSIPFPVAKPPPFSPPRYAVWVNSLWFLSLVMSLSCAPLATLQHQCTRRYIRLTQPGRCSPEKRARIRAFFADGMEKMHYPWAVEALPTLLHLSLFLFFWGLIIFLFNTDHEVFSSVVWWIILFSIVYGLITLLPLIRHDSPYNSPLSTPTWFLYAGIQFVFFKILAFIALANPHISCETYQHYRSSRELYRRWMLGGVEKAAEEEAEERSAEIDVRILDWTISALGDDDSLKNFFEVIPDFFNSKLVKVLERDFPDELHQTFWDTLDGFLGRTWSSNSINDSEKLRRLDISINAMSSISVSNISSILYNILFKYWDEVPQTLEMGHTLARWCTSNYRYTDEYAQSIIGRILGSASAWERNDSWVMLAARAFGLTERELRDNIADGGDSVLLAILIHISRRSIHSGNIFWGVFETLSKLDMSNTLPRLQRDFCTLWNEIVQEARNRGFHSDPVTILYLIRHSYIALHQGTDAAPTAFSASTAYVDPILSEPSSYPLCNIASHRPESSTHIPVPDSPIVSHPTHLGGPPDASTVTSSHSPTHSGSIIVPQPAEQANITAGPPSPTGTSDLGETPSALTVTVTAPIDSGPQPTFSPPPAANVRDDGLRNGRDQGQTIPMEVFHHQIESLRLVPSPSDTVSNSLEHEGH